MTETTPSEASEADSVHSTGTRTRAGQFGALPALERQGDASARAALAFGRRYAARRRRELGALHGTLSSAVGAMLDASGDVLGAARYWSSRAVAASDPGFARTSASLLAEHARLERHAFDLSELESAARRRAGLTR